MQSKTNYLWLVVLLLGWLFDLLFWQHIPGISLGIYVVLTLAAGFGLLWSAGIRPSMTTLWILPFIIFAVAVACLRLEPLTIFLAYAFTLLFMGILVLTFRGGRWINYGLLDYFMGFLDLFASLIVRPLTFMAENTHSNQASTEQSARSANPWPVIRGLLLALPIVAFFAALLSSADLVFAQHVQGLADLLRLENLPEYIFRIIYILVVAYLLAGIFLHAAARSTDEKLFGVDKPLLAPFLGFTEASVVLGSVIILFVLFVIVQFEYFFGGQANIRIEGYTYAEYVHRGFGELVTVAFFSLLLFLGLSAIVKRETHLRQRVFSGLGLGLLALVGIILLSAYQRLILYEAAYGFTRLRTYIHVFMIWVGILLAAVVVLDLVRRQRAFAVAALLASFGFAVTLMIINVDDFIVRQNVERTTQGKDLDVGYLASLSPDAVPGLVSLYQTPRLDQTTRDRLGAVLACFQADRSRAPRADGAWQSFHFAQYWADGALLSVKSGLAGYVMDDSEWQFRVTTPLGETYPCYEYNMD